MRPAIFCGAAILVVLHTLAASAQQTATTPEQLEQMDQLRAALSRLEQQFQRPSGPTGAGGQTLVAGPGTTYTPVPGAVAPGIYESYAAALRDLGAPVPAAKPRAAATAPQPAGQGAGKTPVVRPDLPGPVAKIPVGYVAAGTLTMTVNSDAPGPWRGTLSQPIYSIDRSQVLFPEGSLVVGRVIRISGVNEAINNRLGLLPTYLVRPDGEAFPIPQQAILDQLGIGGIADEVDYHLGVQLAAVGAFTAVNSLPEILAAKSGATPDVAGNFFQLSAERGQLILNRYLTLLPTITVKAGTEFRVFFSEEMVAPLLRPRDRFELTNMGTPTDGAPQPVPRP